MITVTLAATSKRLTTVERIKRELNLIAEDRDQFLGELIDEASALCVAFCNREFARETVSETVRATGVQLLRLSRRPVVSISSITLTLSDDSTETVSTDNYRVRDDGAFNRGGWNWTARQVFGVLDRQIVGSEEDAYTVAYIGGYICPELDGRTLPTDVERGCIEAVKALYGNARRDPRIVSEDFQGGYTATLDTAMGILPPTAIAALQPYRTYAL